MINDFFTGLGGNLFVIGFCSAITIIGFILTLFILVRTKKIDRRIKEFKVKKSYNEHRKHFKDSLLSLKNAIEVENADIKKNKGLLLDELNNLQANYHSEFNAWQNYVIKRLIQHLEKDKKFNRNYICVKLSKVASYLYENKEEIV